LRPRTWVLLGLALALLCAPARADLEVRATLQPTRVEIGRTLTMRVEVRCPENVPFTPPPAEALQVPPLEVRDAVLVALEPEPGWRGWGYTLRLVAWEPGRIPLPPLRFGTAQGPALNLEVLPAPVEPRGQILEPPAPPPPAPGLARLALAATLGLVGALLLALLTRRWWAPRVPAAPSPERVLLDRLDALLGGDRPAGDRLEALGRIVRVELERRQGWPAGRHTTAEMRQLLSEPDPGWIAILEEADQARFSRQVPEVGRLNTLVEKARDLLRKPPC